MWFILAGVLVAVLTTWRLFANTKHWAYVGADMGNVWHCLISLFIGCTISVTLLIAGFNIK